MEQNLKSILAEKIATHFDNVSIIELKNNLDSLVLNYEENHSLFTFNMLLSDVVCNCYINELSKKNIASKSNEH